MHATSAHRPCYSMTGFASQQREFAGGRLSLELRSVNSRFLDLSFRMPDECRLSEPVLRERLSSALVRGKVECRVSLQRDESWLNQALSPDESLLARLRHWQVQVKEMLPDAMPLSVAETLRWPGVLADTPTDNQALSDALLAALDECLAQLLATREREGTKLATVLVDRCAAVTMLIDELQPQLPALRAAYQKRAADKWQEALGLNAPQGAAGMTREEIAQRLSTEVALYAMRADVDEELERLRTHLKEVQRVLTKPAAGGIGKRLDFLMQELHREANTLGSKAQAIEMSNASLEMKLLIEQMREQVQNLE